MRTNMKLERLRRRVIDTEAKAALSVGTPEFSHRHKIFQQRSRLLTRAEDNGEQNRDVNRARNLSETRA